MAGVHRGPIAIVKLSELSRSGNGEELSEITLAQVDSSPGFESSLLNVPRNGRVSAMKLVVNPSIWECLPYILQVPSEGYQQLIMIVLVGPGKRRSRA